MDSNPIFPLSITVKIIIGDNEIDTENGLREGQDVGSDEGNVDGKVDGSFRLELKEHEGCIDESFIGFSEKSVEGWLFGILNGCCVGFK